MVEPIPLCSDNWSAVGDHSCRIVLHFCPERLHKTLLILICTKLERLMEACTKPWSSSPQCPHALVLYVHLDFMLHQFRVIIGEICAFQEEL